MMTQAQLQQDSIRVVSRLRLTLKANACFSLITGALGLIFAGFWSDKLGFGSTLITALVAGSLIPFGAAVWWASGQPRKQLEQLALAISLMDMVWVLLTVGVLATVSLTTAGWIVVVLQGMVVADFALTQLFLRQR